MVAVLPAGCVAVIPSLAETVREQPPAEKPATRLLAEIPPECSHVPDLGNTHLAGCLVQEGIFFRDQIGGNDLAQRSPGPDLQAVFLLLDIIQLFDPLDVDQRCRHLELRPFDAVLHHGHKVGPPGQDGCLLLMLGKERNGLGYARDFIVIKRFHGLLLSRSVTPSIPYCALPESTGY